MVKTAVVILNWNGEKMLRKFLPTVLQHTPAEAEVWVADNASTDASMALLEKKFPKVKTLLLDKNFGFAEGYNRALKEIEAEYYVLLNSDIEITGTWLEPLVSFMDNHPEAAACQPKLLSQREKSQFEYAGASGGFIDRYGYPFCRGRIMSSVEADHSQYDTPLEIHWATGACMLVRAHDYWEAGGLDGRFFAHNEEIDLCWRLRIRGKKIYCLPASSVYHVGGGTLPKNNPWKTYLNFRNNLTMLYKNLPAEELKPVMRVRWWLDRVAALQALLTGRWGDCKAIIGGRNAYRKWQSDFAADRDKIQQSRQTAGAGKLAPLFLLWQYYAKGKKKYSELPL